MSRRLRRTLCLLAISLMGAAPAPAEDPGVEARQKAKCTRYSAAWSETLKKRGTDGLGRPFLEAHEAFLASGCTTQGHVCPRSAAELDLANRMTILAMNAGTASTFLPFACRN